MTPWLGLDKRSLGLFRIAVGLLVLYDILNRSLWMRAHYTLDGVMPLAWHLDNMLGAPSNWSLLYISDSIYVVGLLFLMYFVAAVSLTIGYRVRISGWICWAMALSVVRRSPLLIDSGDLYFVALLFWGNFLPWGDRFSVQARDDDENSLQTLGGFCYLVQVGIVYWFSAVLRTGKEWQVDDSALYYALHVEPLNWGLTDLLLRSDARFLAFITAVTIILEMVGPFLLFLKDYRIRILSVVMVMLFHFGIVMTLRIPFFATVGMIGPLGLLPGEVWNWKPARILAEKLKAKFASLRQKMGMARPQSLSPRFVRVYEGVPVVFLLILIFYLNAGARWGDTKPVASGVTSFLGLDQRWTMFSPMPSVKSGWEAVQARTLSGHEFNLLDGKEMPRNGDGAVNNTFVPKSRWRQFHFSHNYPREIPIRQYLIFLVNSWNREHPEDPVVTAQYLHYPKRTKKKHLLSESPPVVHAVYHRSVKK